MTDTTNISPTFCPFPWMHLHAWPDGKAMLCCKAHGGKHDGKIGDISKNSYAEIMNSDKMKEIRLDMLNGKTIPQCIACTTDERLKTKSFREVSIQTYKDHIPNLLHESYMLEDGTLVNPKMLYMDFRFSNLCNLGCQTCGSPLSSTIANNRDDNSSETNFLKEKKVLSERGTITSFVYARPNFFEEDVLPYIDNVEGFYFAGGEPLMHQEHLDLLNYLDEKNLHHRKIIYSTNLTLLKWKKTNFLEKWKNFEDIIFMCSIDGDHERLEYIREFSKHEVVFKNIKQIIAMKKSHPEGEKRYRVHLCYTHSIYNCYYTLEFFKALIDEGILEDLDHIEFNCSYGDNNSPAILPEFAKKELIEKRNKDRASKEMIRAFKLFPEMKQIFDSVDEMLFDKMPENEFDRLISSKSLEKIKKSLPWLYSVIKRYKIV